MALRKLENEVHKTKPSGAIFTYAGALVARRQALAAVREHLEGDGEEQVHVHELQPDGHAQAYGGVHAHQPLDHRAACLLRLLPDPDVD